jgi:hypothetical protein
MTIPYILIKLDLDPEMVKITVNTKDIIQVSKDKTLKDLGISHKCII